MSLSKESRFHKNSPLLPNVNSCGRQSNGSPKMSKLQSTDPDYVSLHSKRDFAGMIKLKIMRWGDYAGLSGGPNVIKHKVLGKERQRVNEEFENTITLGW